MSKRRKKRGGNREEENEDLFIFFLVLSSVLDIILSIFKTIYAVTITLDIV